MSFPNFLEEKISHETSAKQSNTANKILRFIDFFLGIYPLLFKSKKKRKLVELRRLELPTSGVTGRLYTQKFSHKFLQLAFLYFHEDKLWTKLVKMNILKLKMINQ